MTSIVNRHRGPAIGRSAPARAARNSRFPRTCRSPVSRLAVTSAPCPGEVTAGRRVLVPALPGATPPAAKPQASS